MGIVSDILQAAEVPGDIVEQIGPTLDRLGLAEHFADFLRAHVDLTKRVAALEGDVHQAVETVAADVGAAPAEAAPAADPKDAEIAALKQQLAALQPAAPAETPAQ